MQTNLEIRERARERGVHLYEIGYELGMNDGNFSRKLRRELPDSEKTTIFEIIDRLARCREDAEASDKS